MSTKWFSLSMLVVATSVFSAACAVAPESDENVGEAEQAIGEFCGGIASFQCPDGLVCVDDPSDDCDPNQGGADCGGVCVRGKKPKKPHCGGGKGVSYVSKDPNQCAAISFLCADGAQPFFNECGCGCEPATCDYNDPDRSYVGTSQEQCSLVKFFCEEGTVMFSDSCGCGCEIAN